MCGKVTALLEGLIAVGALVERLVLPCSLSLFLVAFFYLSLSPALSFSLCFSSMSASSALMEAIPKGTPASAAVLREEILQGLLWVYA